MPSTRNLSDIFSEIQNANTGGTTLTVDYLRGLASQASAQVTGAASDAITLLYSGRIGDSVYASEVVKALADAHPGQVLTIGQTDVATLIEDRDFKIALQNAVSVYTPVADIDVEINRILSGVDAAGNRISNDSLWDDASRRFAEAATGDVRTLTPFADPTRVFAQTELPALLSNPNVTHIDGYPKDYFVRMKADAMSQGLSEADALERVRATVSTLSQDKTATLEFNLDANGAIARNAMGGLEAVGTRNYFADTLITGSSLPEGGLRTLGGNVMAGAIEAGQIPTTHADSLRQAAAGLDQLKQYAALDNAGHLLNKLGVLGDILGVMLAASAANAAYASGDTAGAQQILRDWALDFAGGLAGGLAAAQLVGSALAPLYIAGPAGALLAGGLTLLAGLVGGIAGGQIAVDLANFFNSARSWQPVRYDPLALDLDGDGIETVGADGTVLFDHDGDGLKNATGWLQGDDAWVVWDRDGNGSIDSGAELFGADTVLSSGHKATDGFAALRDLDGNGDGVFNSADAHYADLQVWRDLDQDGLSQAAELQTLVEAGVAAIDLNPTATTTNLGNGNQLIATGHYTSADGTPRTAANLNLAQNLFYREYTPRTFDQITLTDAALALPDLQASGQVRDLREAANESIFQRAA